MTIEPIQEVTPLRVPVMESTAVHSADCAHPMRGWAIGTGDVATKLATIDTPTGVGSIDFSGDGSQLALDSFGYDGTDIYDLKRKQMVHHLPFSGTNADRGELVRYSPNGRLLAVRGFNKSQQRYFMGVYDTGTWETVHEIVDEPGAGEAACKGIAFTPDGKDLVRSTGVPALAANDPRGTEKYRRLTKWPLPGALWRWPQHP